MQVCHGAEGDLKGVLSRGSGRAGFGSTGSSLDGMRSTLLLQACTGEDSVGCEVESGGKIDVGPSCTFTNKVKLGGTKTPSGENRAPENGNATSGKGRRTGLRAWIRGKR
jgi:hypothetical protein